MNIPWERVARATAHHLQISILELLTIDGGRTLSVNEMRLELQFSLGNVGYHATALRDAGLVELVAVRQVRGAAEHFYRLVSDGGERS